ncbi:double-strand break repair helicase AddA [Magnetospirillum moscoviense]|uniref:DNA 3'-5' helicase n=1 Tax=Magnetospirillum moscoviense TaxID=1437059 RepID=A0A178MXE2_9PROT|nr:double-strand break repair helicase AddA [Magnetospirillum moscoviense]OAN53995.1 double-strand break repair helicase AddA [Magnetospirillum moscoviense]
MNTPSTALLDDATTRQRRAADPASSVWVAASAGTGKTKVLTDRVLSLLLAGTPPSRILCLTFTKAAAAEMSIRINGRLAGWATAADAQLARDLVTLLGRDATELEQTRARRLFAAVLDAPGGMHIETIHAFCQSLLRRFPLEAGLAPHFQVMDERDAGELLEDSKDEVLTQARDGADPTLAEALGAVTRLVHETAFPELMAELAGDRGRLRRLIDRHGGLAGLKDALWSALGLDPTDSAEAVVRAATADHAFDRAGLVHAAQSLLNGSDADARKGETMAAWLAAPERRADALDEWVRVFLTNDGTIRKSLATKKVLAIPGVEAALATEAERVLRLTDRLKSVRVGQATLALLTLGQALLAGYETRKRARAVMDYDDLILAARDLLAHPGVAPWVLYKLDGGIDHVLIDEAQDTNPDQWAVVERLTAEFFAGRGSRELVRTIFAVGDVKQSIYSFQRADPAAFDAMRRLFAEHVPAAGQDWAEIPLNLSFRSTSAVLDAVDAVFTGPARDGVLEPEQGDDQRHIAFRQGQAGLVELWPPVCPRAVDDPPPWKPPIERIKGDSPSTRLARLVAGRIAAMVGGESLESQGRPVRAGDIMVLLRRRGGFVEDLVRELKALAVPVAGADRMVLTEQLAVMDLMALGAVLLLPEDDLTLATVLKGPLVGLTEEQLFELAWNRGPVPLWEALQRRAGFDRTAAAALDYLTGLMALTDRLGPADLFAHILGPKGGKRALLARLGPDAADPIDEFVNLTLAFERGHPPSLQGFLRWLEQGAVEIKRDLEQGGRDAVRIMTVHGSKGLQAPIVFLPDTLQMPTKGPRLLWSGPPESEMLLWPPSAESDDSMCAAARAARKLAAEREYRRLLYVAMTRAEDRLIVCGWETKRQAPAACWYKLVKAGLEPLAERVEDSFLAAAAETETATILRLTCPQTAPPDRKASSPDAHAQAQLPEPSWLRQSPPPEPAPPRPLAPSAPEGEEPPVRSPLGGTDGNARFQRGRLIHRLLELLPEIPREGRARAAIRFLTKSGIRDSGQALTIAGEVADILDHARFAPLFAPGSRAEVPIVGLVGDNRAISGRVDRLVVTADEVLVVDYKTNRRPPAAGDPIPAIYVKQMAAYRLALACIYPGKRIRCALVWTDGPRLAEIDAAHMDDALG